MRSFGVPIGNLIDARLNFMIYVREIQFLQPVNMFLHKYTLYYKQKMQTEKLANSIAAKQEQILEIYHRIKQDMELKKGKRLKFTKHKEDIDQIFANSQSERAASTQLISHFAIIYYNLARLGDNEESLEKAIKIIQNLPQRSEQIIKWNLQLAALKSSDKKHQECYDLACNAQKLIISYFQKLLKTNSIIHMMNTSQLIRHILIILKQKQRDEIVWLHNERIQVQKIISQIKKQFHQEQLPIIIPFYSGFDFHIADYMALQTLSLQDLKEEKNYEKIIQQTIIFASISCFTKATEKYYMKDYSQKYNHFKALKIGLYCFDVDCTYNNFLTIMLADHFGKKMTQIFQQNSQIIETNELKYHLPKQKSQISCIRMPYEEDNDEKIEKK